MIIIGTGSGNSVLTPDFDSWNVAIVERDVFGGTCLNRGCIPSKMFVYPASIIRAVQGAAKLGVHGHIDRVDWPAIRDRTFGRIDPIAAGGEEYRRNADNITVFAADARFVDHKVLNVGTVDEPELITADTIVIAAGARSYIPDITGLDGVDYHTSGTIMRIAEVPDRLLVLGGGYIGTELGNVFSAFGSAVTIASRGPRLLSGADESISQAFTEQAADYFDLRLNSTIASVAQSSDGEIEVSFADGSSATADALLVAIGRVPNGNQLDVAAGGVAVDDDGYVITDAYQRTNVEGVWALGDVCTRAQLKHVANAQQRVVSHNIVHPDKLIAMDYSGVPYAVFTSPEIGAVGATEQALRAEGRDYLCAIQRYADVAYGWAMEDTVGFCKLLVDPTSRTILGAHILGNQASTLIQQLVGAMQFGVTIDDLAHGQLWVHPALTEVIENALLAL